MGLKMPEIFEVWLAWVTFTQDLTIGKYRPVVIISRQGQKCLALPMGSRGSHSSYAMNSWKKSGLDKPTHIETYRHYEVTDKQVAKSGNVRKLGVLHDDDIIGLEAHIKEQRVAIDRLHDKVRVAAKQFSSKSAFTTSENQPHPKFKSTSSLRETLKENQANVDKNNDELPKQQAAKDKPKTMDD